MKILYITDHTQTAFHSGGYINDYLSDLIFYGFYELFLEGSINEVVDSIPIVHLYKNNRESIPEENLWGGFTTTWLIHSDTINRDNIPEKIKSKYFDLIVYGNIRRCKDFFETVKKAYKKEQIVFLDGNDDILIDPIFIQGSYFKRELINIDSLIRPISFSIPSSKISNLKIKKTQEFGTVIPGEPDTYIFENELDYYLDYRKSYYGITARKAGWDCMRHYEIFGNYCMPYFWDLENCPEQCLFNFPKDIVKEAMNLSDQNFDEKSYFELLDLAFEYTKTYLTTKATAEYILSSLNLA